jgi:drug/metabolite transporter (DMT)-like permease
LTFLVGNPAPAAASLSEGRNAAPPFPDQSGAAGDSAVGKSESGALRGILLILAAGGLFSVSDTIAKWLTQSLPVIEVVWIRYATFAAMAMALAGRQGRAGFRTRQPVLQVVRGLALVGSALFFVLGLRSLPIAEATAINFVSPAFITALSIPILKEVVGIYRWGAIVVGLIGVLIVVRPGTSAFQVAAIFPIMTAASWACAVVVTRKMGGAEKANTTIVWSAVTGLLVLTFILPTVAIMPTVPQIGLGLLLGMVSSTGQWLIVIAYRRTAASMLAPFSYCQVISSAFMGYMVFNALPSITTLIGGAVIVASGIYTAHRERVRAKQRLATVTA